VWQPHRAPHFSQPRTKPRPCVKTGAPKSHWPPSQRHRPTGDFMHEHSTDDPDPAQSPPTDPETVGTTLAINPPPLTILKKDVTGRLIAKDMPSFSARRAERIFSAFVAATPPGARRQWRTRRAVQQILFSLDEGISEGDLLDHFEGAAELIRRGYQEPRWWSLANVLGPKTLERWRADIHDMRRTDARDRELERRDAEHREQSRSAPPPKVTDLRLQKLAREMGSVYREHLWREDDDEAEHG